MKTQCIRANYNCPVLGCRHKRKPNQVMCRWCWYQVPEELQARVWNLFATARYSSEHRAAIEQAIAAVPPAATEKRTHRTSTDAPAGA